MKAKTLLKLYILRPVKNDPLWDSWYDKAFGFVVAAETPVKARKLAAEEAGDEGEQAWLDAAHPAPPKLEGEK